MGIGSNRNKNINSLAIDLDGSFKSVNSTIEHNDLTVQKKSFLKKLGSIPGTGILLAVMSSVCFSTGKFIIF